ncbi:NACHT domain-containing NTPase [Corallococcus sp. AB018]|uniref:NACHT domain-containing protein n=1 Tax=Corallococcus sp. AB018 TaxID=2316715 RepID=UPI0013153C5C|nr:NACHT domain-containing protein [Corallococcus sp. AB018]
MINAKRASDSLAKNLATDADIIKEFATAIAFPTVLLALTTPTPLAIGSALLAAAAAGVKSFSKVLERLEPEKAGSLPLETTYERFRLAYYTLVQRTIVESIAKNQELSKALHGLSGLALDFRGVEQFTRTVSERAAAIGEAELRFHYTVAPTDKQLALYGAYQEWLSSTLECLNIQEASKLAGAVMAEARERFRVSLAKSDPLATWMRNYLALEQESQTSESILSQLTAIGKALEGWKSEVTQADFRPARWQRYRNYLRALPDQKDTMYNEDFGVSRVFVAPRVRYHRAGLLGTADTPEIVPDVGRLIGALVSTRLEETDLIILSGGPGSGKSTLCRMIASELARDSNMHPVFLRLRRQREGADVTAFIEEHLVAEDAISKLSDLHAVPNLILIMDGFDELVMASKTKLKTFFASLLDAASHGPLRNAKFIISGRDTLFPGGTGLPRGSHVLTVLPFDKERVTAWGSRWRTVFSSGLGASFYPEAMLDSSERKTNSQGALHQLATWPLTLHLIAQLHTAGRMSVGDPKAKIIEKAYLYRSILAETSRRQTTQTVGRGWLEPEAMRKFLRAIAWEMYIRTTDTLEVETVVPIVRKLFPKHEEVMLSELTEVAVVNAPEIKKGEETGFEFVHKSFAEFLVAESIGQDLDAVVHRVEDVSGGETWHQSTEDAAKRLLACFGPRLLPVEVEDMLRPMLGGFRYFMRGENVDDQPDRQLFLPGLSNILNRTQEIYRLVIEGRLLSLYEEAHQKFRYGRNSLEVGANLAASVVLIGSTAAERLRETTVEDSLRSVSFMLEPVDGGMWRWLFLMSAGGVQVDEGLARRLFKCTRLPKKNGIAAGRDFGLPVQLGLLSGIEGYESNLIQEIKAARDIAFTLTSRAALLCTLLAVVDSGVVSEQEGQAGRPGVNSRRRRLPSTSHFAGHLMDRVREVFERLLHRLAEAGMVSQEENGRYPRMKIMNYDHFLDDLKEELALKGVEIDDLITSISSSLCLREPEVLRDTGRELIAATNEKSRFIDALLKDVYRRNRRSGPGRRAPRKNDQD